MHRKIFSTQTQALYKHIFKVGAFKTGTFKLAAHDENPKLPDSPFFVNLRTPDNPKPGPLMPDIVATMAQMMLTAVEKGNHLKFDFVCGIPNAGVPFAEALAEYRTEAQKTPTRLLKLYKRATKGHGRSFRLRKEHHSQGRESVLLVDDLITSASVKWKAIDALRRGGYEVAGVAVFLDREQGGVQELLKKGIRVRPVATISDMLSVYNSAKLIDAKTYSRIKQYLKDNGSLLKK